MPRIAGRSGLVNRAQRKLATLPATRNVGPSVSDGRAKTKHRCGSARSAAMRQALIRGFRKASAERDWMMSACWLRIAVGSMLVALAAAPAHAAEQAGTASGLPVPRFVSLKSDKVNVRAGPTKDHDVAWVYSRAGAAGRGHGRIRELAPHPRLGRRRGLGLPLAAVGPAHRAGLAAAEGQGRAARAARQARRGEPPSWRSCRPACSASVKRCQDGWCRVIGEGFDGWIEQAAPVGRLSEREGRVARAMPRRSGASNADWRTRLSPSCCSRTTTSTRATS